MRGVMEKGEEPLQAAQRELPEETDLQVANGKNHDHLGKSEVR